MPKKTAYQLGMEAVLNNPSTSFLTQPRTFNEIYSQSKMSMNAMMKHIGGKVKQKKKEPSDAERSKERLDTMESQQK
jgi:hypothetical protein